MLKKHNKMARTTGLEPVTNGLEIRCSVQLSYVRNNERFFLWLKLLSISPAVCQYDCCILCAFIVTFMEGLRLAFHIPDAFIPGSAAVW